VTVTTAELPAMLQRGSGTIIMPTTPQTAAASTRSE